MSLALRADSPEADFVSGRSEPASRATKFVVAGVAAATVGVLAINPVTPTLPTLAELPQPAVAMAAAVNPLVVLQETFTNTLNNLNLLGTAIPTASTALLQALSNPAVYAEFGELITANLSNPQQLLNVLQNIGPQYGTQVSTALQNAASILQTNLSNFPTILQNTIGYLQTGQFVEAFSELNIYFLVSILERPAAPLFPLFAIPGDIAAAIPGGGVLANLLDAVVNRGVIATGLSRALLVAPITATLFVAETLDHVQASIKVGDWEAALSELVAAPVGIVNAFLNGYVPDFPTRSPFQGLLSPNGFFDYFLVDVPNAIANALNLPPQTPPAPPTITTTLVADTAPTDLGLGADTTLLKLAAEPTVVEAAVETEAETEVVAAAPTEVEPAAPTEVVAEPVSTVPVETPAVETAPVSVEPTETEPAGGATAPVSEEKTTDKSEDKTEDKSEDKTTDKDAEKAKPSVKDKDADKDSDKDSSKVKESVKAKPATTASAASKSSDSSSDKSAGSDSGSDSSGSDD